MFYYIKNLFIQMKDKTFATLWVESLMFSVLLGIGFRSWLVFGLMLIGLSCLLNQWWKGRVYTIIALSFIWGFIAASIGYSFGGWIWALVLGVVVLIKGVRVHFRKLKLSWGSVDFLEDNNTTQWRQNWYLGRYNLN